MAYAAVISLKQTTQRLAVNSCHIFIVPPRTRFAIQSAYEDLESLQEVLERLDIRTDGSSRHSERVTVLDGQIRDAVHKIEDVLESHISFQFLKHYLIRGEKNPILFSINWNNLRQEIDSFVEMKKEYLKELDNPLPEKNYADSGGEIQSTVVGLSVEYSKLKDHLMRGRDPNGKVVAIVGMAGIGKTTLAKMVLGDPKILKFFKCRAWVRVGQKFELKEIVRCILDQVNPEMSSRMVKEGDLKDLHGYLCSSLMLRRYLIVLDDVWASQILNDLERLLPYFGNQSRILVTTRVEQVTNYVFRPAESAEMRPLSGDFHRIQMRLLDKEESWHLLRERVFGENQLCPPQLEKAGKKIAEKCDGLPLTIVTIASLLLSKVDKTVKYWNRVAHDRKCSVFVEAYDQISKVLIPSYHHLPQHLKPCFLYMGVFPQNYEIPTSKLINLWRAEGLLDTGDRFKIVGEFAMNCLKSLVSHNLLMVHDHSYDCRIKTCSLHSAFWQLCIRVARENKFMHVLNSYADGFEESIKGQRRLCIHNNVLFSIKDVHDSMSLISTAHSLLCTGKHHQYPVPLCLGLRLLRVLDALTIRFYEFPVEVSNLVHLRYLALTYNGKLPSSISKLWNLQFLIVRQHLSIKSPIHSLYLPVEICGMKELKHLQVMGSDLPNPKGGAFLQNLVTLLDVSSRSCTKGFLEKIRGLKKLGIRIELGPDAAELLTCFRCVSNLSLLESLKCVVVNPILLPEIVAPPPTLLSRLPSRLKKLSLSGFGYGWENMSKIASLPNLEVLKLRCYAFQGPKWTTQKEKFWKLEYLLIEDTDLESWRCNNRSFPSLKHLILRHCYKLKEIPRMSRQSKLQMIEVVDSNPSVLSWAKQEDVVVKHSWDEENLKS